MAIGEGLGALGCTGREAQRWEGRAGGGKIFGDEGNDGHLQAGWLEKCSGPCKVGR